MPGQLPSWAEQAWSKLVAQTAVHISTRLNPFVWRGDFDGNGRADLALLIAENKTKKEVMIHLTTAGFYDSPKMYSDGPPDPLTIEDVK